MCCVYLHNFIIDVDGAARAERLLKTRKEHTAFVYYQDKLVANMSARDHERNSPGFGPDMRKSLQQRMQDSGIVRGHLD
jgi:hypothetical protein